MVEIRTCVTAYGREWSVCVGGFDATAADLDTVGVELLKQAIASVNAAATKGETIGRELRERLRLVTEPGDAT